MKEINENLMSDRSVNIILITKYFNRFEGIKKAIAQYMHEECLSPIQIYSDEILFNIVKDVMFDFFHHTTDKCYIISFVRYIIDCDYESMLDKILAALSLIRVANVTDGKVEYINGWHKTDFTQKLEANEWTMKWK